jgi:hypothetical protein
MDTLWAAVEIAVVTVVRVLAPLLTATPPCPGNTMSEARRSRESLCCGSHGCHRTPAD